MNRFTPGRDKSTRGREHAAHAAASDSGDPLTADLAVSVAIIVWWHLAMATALKRIADPHRHLATKQRWRSIEAAFWLATLLAICYPEQQSWA